MTAWDVVAESLGKFDSFWLYLFWIMVLSCAYRGFVKLLYYLTVMIRGWSPSDTEPPET